MGPEPVSSGKRPVYVNTTAPADTLQWGRNWLAPENGLWRHEYAPHTVLQWGRSLLAPEKSNNVPAKYILFGLQWGRSCVAPENWSFPLWRHYGDSGFNGAGAG